MGLATNHLGLRLPHHGPRKGRLGVCMCMHVTHPACLSEDHEPLVFPACGRSAVSFRSAIVEGLLACCLVRLLMTLRHLLQGRGAMHTHYLAIANNLPGWYAATHVPAAHVSSVGTPVLLVKPILVH